MTKKTIGTTKLVDLKIGQFASVNGSIVYRYKPYDDGLYIGENGTFIIEEHNHLPMIDAYRGYEVGRDTDNYGFYCDVIDRPEKKHVDNAICILKKEMREGKLNGLTYVDNYVTLKGYLKPDEA